MPVYLDVEARLDNRAFQDIASRAERELGGAGRTAGRALTSGLDEAFRGITSQFGEVGRSAETAFSGISTKAKVGALGIAGIGVAAVAVGKQFYDLGAQWDSIADGITIRTGKIGDELKSLTDVVGRVGSTTAASLGSIGDIVGQLAQSMPGLAANNTAMEQMASNLAFLDANGQAVNIRELGEAFRVFRVDAGDSVKTFDDLAQVSRATGLPINELVATVKNGAPQFKLFGLSIGEATGLIASFEEAGLNTAVVVTGLRTGLKNLSGDARGAGPALADAITQIKALGDSGGDAAGKTAEIFGTRNAAAFTDAIVSGTLNAEGLKKVFDELGLSLQQMQAETDDGAQEFTKLGNTLKTELGPVANSVFGAINDLIKWSGRNLHAATEEVNNLATSINSLNPDALASALGLPGMPGAPAAPAGPGLPTTRPGTPTTGLAPNFYKDWYKTPDQLKQEEAERTRGATLPDAPVLPFNTSLPPGFAGLPQTAGIFSAQSSYMDANSELEAKRARLQQLQGDNNAKAEDIQKAQNDVTTAERGRNEAELRLFDARQTLYDKDIKALNSHTDALGQIGVALDQDLGISKGLAGFADNLVRFIGSLAAAPLLGQLNAISQAQGGIDKTGSGMIGMLAQQGAFGQQYTPAAMAAAAAAGGGGGGSGYQPSGSAGGPGLLSGLGPVGMPRPGESARGFAHRVMMPFWEGQGFEVGDHGADQYGEHQNGALDIMVNDLAEGNKVLQEVLADPNVYGAIFNNQTYGYGHGATPQDYSAGHTGNPTQDHQDHIHAWYKPGGTGNIRPGPAASAGPGGGGMPGSPNWDGTAQGESSGNWQANTGNGYFGGLQFKQSSWEQAGGMQYAPRADLASPQQQKMVADQLLAQQGPGAWPNTFQSFDDGQGWLPPGPSIAINNTGKPEHLSTPEVHAANAPPISSGQGAGPAPGPPGLGQAAGTTSVGGKEKPNTPGGGISGGGMVGAATSAAATAADMFAPGSGAAVQIASQEIQRAIKFAGQATAIGVNGLMETFLPMGASDLAQNNWITRIAGGFAGVQPQIPNVAGKSATVDAMQQKQTPQTAMPPPFSSGKGAGPEPGPPINVTYNNNGAPEDRAAADLTSHLRGMYTSPSTQR